MEQLFNIDFKRINSSNDKDEADRKKNFELFLRGGLPNKKNENWKFSDLNYIIVRISRISQITMSTNLMKKLKQFMILIIIKLFL